MVYKLVSLHDKPRIKLSEEKEKTTFPGSKSVVRVYTYDLEVPSFDVICQADELEDIQKAESIKVFVPYEDKEKVFRPIKVETVTELLYDQGKIVH